MRNALILFAFLLGSLMSGLAQKNMLPEFGFQDLEGKLFAYTQLAANQPTVVVYFDPWCDHCAHQAEMLAGADDKLKDFNIVFVTNTDPDGEASKEFYQTHFKPSELKNVFVLLDPNFYFDGYFGYSEVPSVYVFDAKKNRVAAFTKETSAEDILKKLGM
ncbi:MAG: thioredoxin-like domain-containing protein [Bacteroidia bacterium]